MDRVDDASESSPKPFVLRNVTKGNAVKTDGWSGYRKLRKLGRRHCCNRCHANNLTLLFQRVCEFAVCTPSVGYGELLAQPVGGCLSEIVTFIMLFVCRNFVFVCHAFRVMSTNSPGPWPCAACDPGDDAPDSG